VVYHNPVQFTTTPSGATHPVFQPGTTTAYASRTFTSEYALFTFTDYDGNQQYGWLDLSVQANAPFVELLGYGYTTPEPIGELPAGLAALALGALGLRRWRIARKPAA
jgi:hypothetical protein